MKWVLTALVEALLEHVVAPIIEEKLGEGIVPPGLIADAAERLTPAVESATTGNWQELSRLGKKVAMAVLDETMRELEGDE